jgi:hypothetical protein
MKRLRQWWQRLNRALEIGYYTRHRRALTADIRQRHDALMLMVHADALGIDNPMAHHMLELKVLLADDFHDWHRRAGLDHSVLDCTRCC